MRRENWDRFCREKILGVVEEKKYTTSYKVNYSYFIFKENFIVKIKNLPIGKFLKKKSLFLFKKRGL